MVRITEVPGHSKKQYDGHHQVPQICFVDLLIQSCIGSFEIDPLIETVNLSFVARIHYDSFE